MKNTVSYLRFYAAGLLPALLALFAATSTHAGNATWLLNPADNNWNNPNNWTPNTVPDATTDLATFGVSNTTDISLTDSIDVQGLVFNAGASAYSFTVAEDKELIFWGTGITNNSAATQEFIAAGGTIRVYGGSVGAQTHFNVLGTDATHKAGTLSIWDFSAALGSPTIDAYGSSIRTMPSGQVIVISGTYGSTVVLHRGLNGGGGAFMDFEGGSAGTSNITCEASDLRNAGGATVIFTTAGNALTSTITLEGSDVSGAGPGIASFELSASAWAATLIAGGGSRVGGSIRFIQTSSGGTARIITNRNGSLDISGRTSPGITIGSLEGERKGMVFLGSKNLSVGSSNSITVYPGVIQDGGLSGGSGGSLTKVGTKTLTLTGDNLYTGGTTVTEGNLVVANRAGSATGTGPVQVDAGRIGGAGTIAGALTIGSGSGSGASLMPALRTNKQVTMVIESALTLNADATYSYGVDVNHSSADSMVAGGVTIDPSARFELRSQGSGTLAPGTVFTAINNTASTPISGTFTGLDEGATIVAGDNTYEVSYEGGDGNDFTLTVL